MKKFLTAMLLTSILATGAFAASTNAAPPANAKATTQVVPAVAMIKTPTLKKCPKGSHYMMRKCMVTKKK